MALVRYSSFYLGPLAVYTSRTGLTDIRTGLPELGGNLSVGDFCDLTEREANAWAPAGSGIILHEGRYRFVRLSAQSTTGNTGIGKVVGIAPGTTVQAVTILTAGSGQTDGTYQITANTGGAVVQVVVSGAAVISATVLNGGSYASTTIPTFTVAAGGTPGTLQAQLVSSSNFVSTFDSAAINVLEARGITYTTVTAAQITAGAYIVIQEAGIASVYITTATQTASGSKLWAATASAVTANVGTASYSAELGRAIDVVTASALCRCNLALPIREG